LIGPETFYLFDPARREVDGQPQAGGDDCKFVFDLILFRVTGI
jgi:hypothetical protein